MTLGWCPRNDIEDSEAICAELFELLINANVAFLSIVGLARARPRQRLGAS